MKKSCGELKEFNTADLLPLKNGRIIWGHCDLNRRYFSVMKKENLLKTYQSNESTSGKEGCKLKLETATRFFDQGNLIFIREN